MSGSLELADLRGDVSQVDGLVRFAAGEVGAPSLARDAARWATVAFECPEVPRDAAHRHWKEVPAVATVDGRIVEGLIDLLYETRRDGRWAGRDRLQDRRRARRGKPADEGGALDAATVGVCSRGECCNRGAGVAR